MNLAFCLFSVLVQYLHLMFGWQKGCPTKKNAAREIANGFLGELCDLALHRLTEVNV